MDCLNQKSPRKSEPSVGLDWLLVRPRLPERGRGKEKSSSVCTVTLQIWRCHLVMDDSRVGSVSGVPERAV